MAAVCDYALSGQTDELEAALDDLREVDAKHRLAYALTRAAQVDVAAGRYAEAIARGKEALENATLLDRGTDMLLAHVVLARAYRGLMDEAAFRRHSECIDAFEPGRVAKWARIHAREVLA
jgi:hypothetical protein